MTDPIGTAQERELIDQVARKLAMLLFDTYGDAEGVVWAGLSYAERRKAYAAADSVLSTDALGQLREALQLFVRSAVPVASEINPRGHNWCEAYLDDALKNAAALSLQRRV